MARYLVVDDSPTVRLRVRQGLEQVAGGAAEIREAGTAPAALEAFGQARPDVVFLDLVLAPTEPGGQAARGVDVMQAILALQPDARVVLLTGLPADHPDVVEGISQGAYAHLAKPVDLAALKQVLERAEMELGRLGRIPGHGRPPGPR
jgi:CheY-like chemotaxis protein